MTSQEEPQGTEESGTEESFENLSSDKTLEKNITDALVFNWFIAWPLITISTVILTIIISKKYLQAEFIDEIFHIPMTRQYYYGDFKTWDPKITTPPGLYYIGYIWSKLIKLTHLPFDPVGNTSLRLLNTIAGTVFLPIVLTPLFILNPIGFWPVNIMLFPLLFTYFYLYYTDVWSIVLIVSSLSVAITLPFGSKRSIQLSALLGLFSVTIRQTNIIWNLFVMVLVIERRAMIHQNFTEYFLNNIIKFIIQFLEDFETFCLPYFYNFFLFLAFLLYNGGITLGDKENHVAGLHFAQFFYCCTFIALFSWPSWFSIDTLKYYLRRCKTFPISVLVEFLAIAFFIRFFTVVHPFLLADNRHYTFYIWRKIISLRWYTKYLVIPIYHFSIYAILDAFLDNSFDFESIGKLPFKESQNLPLKPTEISVWCWFICIALTIVPSPLFEPRYYILPFIFFRIFTSASYKPILFSGGPFMNDTLKRLFLETAWFICVNIFTTCVFLFHEFSWDNELHPQRIIW